MLVALRSPLRPETPPNPGGGSFSFLEKRFTPRTVFMEIGRGDFSLALRAAGYVERVYAVDVACRLLQRTLIPCNLRLVLCDGVSIPVPAAKVDLAWSGDFIDRLNADDARDHLASVLRALARGGEYLCVTRGSPEALRRRLLAAGFSAVRIALLSRWLKPVRLVAVK